MNSFIIVVPTYNNFHTIQDVVNDILSYDYKVIVVDDGSSTELTKILKESPNLTIVRHKSNMGKGQAIISGAKKARELGFTHIVTMDGDGQHLASQVNKLISACSNDEIIIGSRNFDISNVPNSSKFGRWFSNFWASWDTGYEIKDSLSGFRLYPLSIIELPIKTSRFDWEMEVIVRHADAGKPIKEVEIECFYPTSEDRVSHFRKFWDTAAIVWVHVQILPIKWVKYIFNLFRFKKS
ncbi:glycosyltransferase family 2 protein [Halarcobacter bivalviorum]|uniref:Glycosyl transferase n=1 Tax=Halarcobacter bivalviorum TaxID=663364 RepID=A0AAX2A614_9BACT|nr:glycosyltransferase family 2 protein [Halarcobacter bivalviorum]AXH11259.1 glycosyltransferase, family 2 [Halarcobacter bivalviorum]RXK09528.1 glycosyl transferase [Halarcobacter bivalviorum]